MAKSASRCPAKVSKACSTPIMSGKSSAASADNSVKLYSIPISSSILEHHINKFKVGGSDVSSEDETECRNATHILTLGPAAIVGAKKIVQSIVDASTAPGKRDSFARLIGTDFSADADERARQLDENPGLWIRMNPNVTSFVLPDLF